MTFSPSQATNIEFMSLYGDPALGMNEAGYYLTTLSVAANFIEKKLQQKELATPEQLVPLPDLCRDVNNHWTGLLED